MATHEVDVAAIKAAALSIAKTQVVSYLVAQWPLLGGFFFNPLLVFFVNLILTSAINETEMGAFFAFIDLRVAHQGSDFMAAAYVNSSAQATGTPQEKADAEAKLISTFRALAVLSS